jgi:hypothetical protein
MNWGRETCKESDQFARLATAYRRGTLIPSAAGLAADGCHESRLQNGNPIRSIMVRFLLDATADVDYLVRG